MYTDCILLLKESGTLGTKESYKTWTLKEDLNG